MKRTKKTLDQMLRDFRRRVVLELSKGTGKQGEEHLSECFGRAFAEIVEKPLWAPSARLPADTGKPVRSRRSGASPHGKVVATRRSRKGADRIDWLVAEFAQNQLAQAMQIDKGNAKQGNRHARRYMKAWEELREKYGDEGRERFSILLEHRSAVVRGTSACYLLRYKTKEALAVLKEVSEMPGLPGLTGFGCAQCLKRWREGTWNLDP